MQVIQLRSVPEAWNFIVLSVDLLTKLDDNKKLITSKIYNFICRRRDGSWAVVDVEMKWHRSSRNSKPHANEHVKRE